VLLVRYLQQRCLLIGSTPYDCPVLAFFHGPVDITEDGCSDVGVPESVDVGLGDVDECVGVGPFEGTSMPRAGADAVSRYQYHMKPLLPRGAWENMSQISCRDAKDLPYIINKSYPIIMPANAK
jgi:hypothetical protein